MTEVAAVEASRRFAYLLDGVEHRGERCTIVRHGRSIAQHEPAAGTISTSGADANWSPMTTSSKAFFGDVFEILPVRSCALSC